MSWPYNFITYRIIYICWPLLSAKFKVGGWAECGKSDFHLKACHTIPVHFLSQVQRKTFHVSPILLRRHCVWKWFLSARLATSMAKRTCNSEDVWYELHFPVLALFHTTDNAFGVWENTHSGFVPTWTIGMAWATRVSGARMLGSPESLSIRPEVATEVGAVGAGAARVTGTTWITGAVGAMGSSGTAKASAASAVAGALKA